MSSGVRTKEPTNLEISIYGGRRGGIAGLATALALKQVGLSTRVLERNPELRASGAALTLFPNAWFALRALGVDHKLTSVYQSLKKSLVTNLETGATLEFDFGGTKDREDTAVRTVHRKALLQALAEELPPDTIRFSSKLISINSETLEDSSTATFLHLEDGTVIKAKVVIGCDGVHSAVAHWLGLSKTMKAGRSAVRGLSSYPEGHGFKMQVRQFIKGGVRAGFIPLNSKCVYWFLTEKSSSSGKLIVKYLE
ncbi:monooxygenase 2-like [Carex rostrata]